MKSLLGTTLATLLVTGILGPSLFASALVNTVAADLSRLLVPSTETQASPKNIVPCAQETVLSNDDASQMLQSMHDRLSRAVEAAPGLIPARRLQGEVALMRCDLNTAQHALETGINLWSSDRLVHYHLGQIYRVQDQPARELTAMALAGNPEHLETMVRRYDWDNDIGLLEQLYRTAVRFDSTTYEGYLGLARVHRRLGRTDEAEQALERAMSQNPNRYEAYYRLGVLRQVQGASLGEVDALFRRAMLAEPNKTYLYTFIVRKYVQWSQVRRAGEWTEEAYLRLPLGAARSVAVDLGQSLVRRDQAERAIPWLQRAIDEGAADSHVYGLLGQAFADVGRTGEARAAYQRALELDPENERARDKLAQLEDADN